MQFSPSPLIIRADASEMIGIGHVMRCLALGQAWQDQGGSVLFLTATTDSKVLKRLEVDGFHIIHIRSPYPSLSDLTTTLSVLSQYPDSWITLDGYHFDSAYQQTVKATGNRLLVIDDIAKLDQYYADIILNQNINAKSMTYSCEPCTHLLLGTSYVLLRSEFLSHRALDRETPDVARRVLVTMGGADPDDITVKVLDALSQVSIRGIEIVVLAGSSYPHLQKLQERIQNFRHKINIVHNTHNMPEWMIWAHIAITAGGSTCWELAYMGVPMLTIILAENQRKAAQVLSEAGVSFLLGDGMHLSTSEIAKGIEQQLLDPENRRSMSNKGRLLISGNGARKVLSAMH